jgi:hypothetical protein
LRLILSQKKKQLLLDLFVLEKGACMILVHWYTCFFYGECHQHCYRGKTCMYIVSVYLLLLNDCQALFKYMYFDYLLHLYTSGFCLRWDNIWQLIKHANGWKHVHYISPVKKY